MSVLRTTPATALIGVAGLVASILGSAVALVITMDQAALHFRRAEISQAQFASILQIARSIDTDDRRRLTNELRTYGQLIDVENQSLPSDDHAQRREIEMSQRLFALSPQSGRPEVRRELAAIMATAIARERTESQAESRAMGHLRRRAWLLTTALLIVAVGSTLIATISLLRANRRLSSEVDKRTAKISAIDASRRLFFAKASHELRTPVTVMRGEAEVALTIPGAEADALRHVVAQADFLEHRIGELLALAQADDGRLQLHFTPTRLDAVATDAISAVQAYAASNDVRLQLENDEPETHDIDRRWLTQAIVAILDNAVKFSNAEGIVVIRIERSVITITDQGIGLMPSAIPRIFDAFYHADEGSRGGSGLGLALANWVVQQHGGTISATNLDAGGCRISIDLQS